MNPKTFRAEQQSANECHPVPVEPCFGHRSGIVALAHQSRGGLKGRSGYFFYPPSPFRRSADARQPSAHTSYPLSWKFMRQAMSMPVEPRFGHGLGVSPGSVPVEARFGHGLGFLPGSVPVEPRFGHGQGVSLRSVPEEPCFGHGKKIFKDGCTNPKNLCYIYQRLR